MFLSLAFFHLIPGSSPWRRYDMPNRVGTGAIRKSCRRVGTKRFIRRFPLKESLILAVVTIGPLLFGVYRLLSLFGGRVMPIALVCYICITPERACQQVLYSPTSPQKSSLFFNEIISFFMHQAISIRMLFRIKLRKKNRLCLINRPYRHFFN